MAYYNDEQLPVRCDACNHLITTDFELITDGGANFCLKCWEYYDEKEKAPELTEAIQ